MGCGGPNRSAALCPTVLSSFVAGCVLAGFELREKPIFPTKHKLIRPAALFRQCVETRRVKAWKIQCFWCASRRPGCIINISGNLALSEKYAGGQVDLLTQVEGSVSSLTSCLGEGPWICVICMFARWPVCSGFLPSFLLSSADTKAHLETGYPEL